MQKKVVLWSLVIIFILAATYVESKQFEIHRAVIALIGIMEGSMLGWYLWRFEKFRRANNWTVNRSGTRKTILCVGLLIVVVTVDRMINYIVALYHKDYNMIWTIVIPGTIIIDQLFKLFDSWAVDYEQKSKT